LVLSRTVILQALFIVVAGRELSKNG